jgi:hypothetical protein
MIGYLAKAKNILMEDNKRERGAFQRKIGFSIFSLQITDNQTAVEY